MKIKNKKLIGQKCDCFFTGAAMLCKLHSAAPDLLAALIKVKAALDKHRYGDRTPGELEAYFAINDAIAKAEVRS